jgi:putative ABC transport system permease protein
VSVNYWALAAPILLWAGLGLLAWRVVEALLGRGRRLLGRLLGPLAGGLRGPAAASLHRQRRAMATGVVLLSLTAAFAISTAVFNTTYRHQVGVEALLTNGAPVTVTEAPGVPAGAAEARALAHVAGVGHVEAVQHRFVYVGADLQDLYGVDATTIGRAGQLQDSYFAGGTAHELLDRLSRQPDAALVSAETVKDFQLLPGDQLTLRLQDAKTKQLVPVPFHYLGIVNEYPTAPTDSFVVANAAYLAQRSGDPSVSSFLVSTHGGLSPRSLARRLRPVVGPGATVSDVDESRHVAGSSLTAVDLKGLTRVELGYALVLAVGVTGLVLGIGFAQRRRAFAIISALGARPRQLAVFARTEAAVFAVLGGSLGLVGGWALAHVLVKVLTGVFDPPPSALSVPWRFLLAFTLCAAAGVVTAVAVQLRSLRRPVVEMVRDL